MSWTDDFKKGIDSVYKSVRKQYPDIEFSCYGGRFYWFLFTRHFKQLHLYTTNNCLLFTSSGAYITEIPFDKIRKLSVKQGLLIKSSYHIRFVADKKYHFLVKNLDRLSTNLTGNCIDNVNGFIDMLKLKSGE